MHFKEKESALNCEKLEKELEILTLKTKMEIRHIELETLKSLVQAESMVRSVGDNAVINRANAYVGFLNVVGNASEGAAIASHTANVVAEIKKISDTNLINTYTNILNNIRNNLLGSFDKSGHIKECSIIAPRTEIKVNEPLEILGFSIYNQNEHMFLIDDEEVLKDSQILLFSSEEEGEKEIVFKVKNDLGTWLMDKIIITITKE